MSILLLHLSGVSAMSSARFEYVALFVGAAFYFQGRMSIAELLILLGAAFAISEIAMHQLGKKIERWPSDRANAERVLGLIATNNVREEIRSLEFGSASTDLLGRFRDIIYPEIKESRFHDVSLQRSYNYLKSTVIELRGVIESEMFYPDIDFDGVMLPLEWKGARFDSDDHLRYRKAQKDLLARSKAVIEAIDAFANCLQGASYRI